MFEITLANLWKHSSTGWILNILSVETDDLYLPLLHLEQDDDELNVIVFFFLSFNIKL